MEEENTYVGYQAGMGISTGISTAFNNVFVGAGSGTNITSGEGNVFMGVRSGSFINSGSLNVFLGFESGQKNIGGIGNVYVGQRAGQNALGNSNIFIGPETGRNLILGDGNLFVGTKSGTNVISGKNNTFIGSVGLPESVATNLKAGNNTSNTIIIADGYAVGSGYFLGRQRLYIDNNGNTGLDIGNDNIPQNRLEVNSTGAVANTLGLRFKNFANSNTNTLTAGATPKVLSVNAQGDVILVDDKMSVGNVALPASCATVNFVPKAIGANGNLGCSQIFDNGTSVGIGTSIGVDQTLGFGYSSGGATGIVKLDVQGVTRTAGFFFTSDRKFKKDIKPIESSLEKVLALDGRTYNWRDEEFKDKNFGNELQYGFLAQEVQKVIPSLVIQSENGDLAMNYIGLIPVLIEAMKEQQTQINELKSQISDNFKSQNQDLLQFANTKIISVSPNPSADLISISVNIDKEVTAAQLQVHDINGTVVSILNLKERATNVTKTLQKDNFGKGIYIVSLVINGKSIDTRKIIFK